MNKKLNECVEQGAKVLMDEIGTLTLYEMAKLQEQLLSIGSHLTPEKYLNKILNRAVKLTKKRHEILQEELRKCK